MANGTINGFNLDNNATINSTAIIRKNGNDFLLHAICLFAFTFAFLIEFLRWSCKKLLKVSIDCYNYQNKRRKLKRENIKRQKDFEKFFYQTSTGNDKKQNNVEMESLNLLDKKPDQATTAVTLKEVAKRLETMRVPHNIINSKESIMSNVDSIVFKSIKDDLDKLDYSLSDKQMKSFIINRIGHPSNIQQKTDNLTVPTTSSLKQLQKSSTIITEPHEVLLTVPSSSPMSGSINRNQNNRRQNKNAELVPLTPSPSLQQLLLDVTDSYKVGATHHTHGLKERVENMFKEWLEKRSIHNETDVERLERLIQSITEQDNDDDDSVQGSRNSVCYHQK